MISGNVLIMGRDETDNQPKPIRYNRGAIDVYLQDQTTPIVLYRVHQLLENVTLAAPTAVGGLTVTLQAGHSAAPGQLLTLYSGSRFYQAIVLNVVVNTLTLDTPLDYAYPVTSNAELGNLDASVNGSVDTVVFHAHPAPGVRWDITQIGVQMIDDAAMDYTKFAGIAALANGCVMRVRNGVYRNIANIKRNGDFRLAACDVELLTKSGGGEYAVNAVCQFGGQGNAGVVIRLDGSAGDEIEILIQDDLTGISAFYIALIGHVVE